MRCRTSRKRSGQIPRFGGLVCKWNQKGVCTVKNNKLFCFQVNQMNPIISKKMGRKGLIGKLKC